MKADQATIRTVDVHDRAGNVVGSKDVMLYAGLLDQAHEQGLTKVRTSILQLSTEENGRLAILKAEVETSKGLFEAIGDACPENVDEFLAPHLIRVAETRAKARALRDAVNCGVVSSEELDGVSLDRSSRPGPGASSAVRTPRHVGTGRPISNGSTQARTIRPAQQARGGGASGPMSDGQRRYLLTILSGQGFRKEAAEDRLKEIFRVSDISEITKIAAMQMISRLLNPAPRRAGNGSGATAVHQR